MSNLSRATKAGAPYLAFFWRDVRNLTALSPGSIEACENTLVMPKGQQKIPATTLEDSQLTILRTIFCNSYACLQLFAIPLVHSGEGLRHERKPCIHRCLRDTPGYSATCSYLRAKSAESSARPISIPCSHSNSASHGAGATNLCLLALLTVTFPETTPTVARFSA